jgi:hypothetical protein
MRFVVSFLHATHALSPKGQQKHLRSTKAQTFYQNDLAMKNTSDIIGGKPIAFRLQSVSGVSAVNNLVTFYDIHGRKGDVLFYSSVLDTTQDIK